MRRSSRSTLRSPAPRTRHDRLASDDPTDQAEPCRAQAGAAEGGRTSLGPMLLPSGLGVACASAASAGASDTPNTSFTLSTRLGGCARRPGRQACRVRVGFGPVRHAALLPARWERRAGAHRGADVGRAAAAVVPAEVACRLLELRRLARVALGRGRGVAKGRARAPWPKGTHASTQLGCYGAGAPYISSVRLWSAPSSTSNCPLHPARAANVGRKAVNAHLARTCPRRWRTQRSSRSTLQSPAPRNT